jgi:hypothetical protein
MNEIIRISDLDLGFEPDVRDERELLRQAVESISDWRQRRKLEHWTLFNFCQAYNRKRSPKFAWVECRQPPAPDYILFTEPDSPPQPVEVTELLDPDRKRDAEYRATAHAQRAADLILKRPTSL